MCSDHFCWCDHEQHEFVNISVNQIEIDPRDAKTSTLSKKELDTFYGLSYESNKGDWKKQMEALENLCVGRKLTLEQLKESYLTDIEGKVGAKEGSDLSAACTIDLTDALKAIEDAINHLSSVEEGFTASLAQYTTVNTQKESTVTICFIARDHLNKIRYAQLDEYAIRQDEVFSKVSQPELMPIESTIDKSYDEQIAYLEDYMLDRRVEDIIQLETYDLADGSNVSLPLPGSDLSVGCTISIGHYIKALEKIR